MLRETNPQLVEQVAADAYWDFVYKFSLQETDYPIQVQNIPSELWSREILLKIMRKMHLIEGNLSNQFIQNLFDAVAQTIVDHNQNDRNILGSIYMEDFPSCKEPDFRFTHLIDELSSDSDDSCNYSIKLSGSNFLKDGDLLLRTPFPSGLLLKSNPQQNCLYIPNTSKALGFQKTIILHVTSVINLPENSQGYKYFLSGVFQMITTKRFNHKWLKLIPNATAVFDSASFQFEDEQISSAKKTLKNLN